MTDPVSDPRSWISSGRFNDVDAQAARYHGYGQQYQQLSPGPFEGRVRSFTFDDDLVIHFEMANRALAQSASTPRGRFGACILAEDSPPCALNAALCAQDQVILCPENKSLEGKTSAGTSIYCLDLSCKLLPDDGFNMRRVGVLGDTTRSRQLRELIQSGLATFTALSSPTGYPAASRDFKSSLADLLWRMAAQTEDNDAGKMRRYTTRRMLRVFRRAREHIDHHLADGISIVALCRDIGVSRRSMEYAFRSVIGIGPGSYIRVLQLNNIRRELMAGTSDDVSIGAVAARHGIWHLSRFSSCYRSLFGELPSQTRLRHARLITARTG
ncbi:MAG TPA: helix-turn-helix domain-containing protein [Steroidobacteraceae bacterium]|nr:helix-turn-helix domain-containing protein [Steroidobacteraceae bacterium]